MKIRKLKNEMGVYDFYFTKEEKTLRIFYGGNLDLYLSLGNRELIPEDENVTLSFDITKENYEIFSLFDALYKDVLAGKVFEEEISDELRDQERYRNSYEYQILVDEDEKINWISDEGPPEVEDKVSISKQDEDTYRLTFYRNDKPMDFGMKNSLNISVRIRNSGSKYDPFNCIFMRMYQKLQDLDPNYHQIHIEEYEYLKKQKVKKL